MLYIADVISSAQFNVYLIVFFVLTSYTSKLATPAYERLGKLAAEIRTFSASLACIEQIPVGKSEWLQGRKLAVQSEAGLAASKIVLQLNGILKRMDYRLNPVVFIPLNILFFWDVQQMLQLVKWQKAYAGRLSDWLTTLGETEAMSGMAALAFNHPEWCFPEMDSSHGSFQATALGHPLINASKRVVSDFSTLGIPMVNIITGSNMAGKSTFLRSVGLAMVMGQAGAPVCAIAARISHMRVMSSMRIADNLEENTSTFYAELKKLKQMIDAVNASEKVLLLMDEILRGTNSLDRHKGSKALIEQLIHHHAAGLVATHDLELADLSTPYPAAIRNYHFDVQVAGEELYFDYALKQGVCQSLNASILMKKIGIELG
jgi:DNA mismatch repair ATPase MutS